MPQSLYIHWPFCPYRCLFCPFVAFAGQDEFMERYHRALMRELQLRAHACDEPIRTIFLGGGTPSTYPLSLIFELFAILKNIYSVQKSAEISIEINPGTITNQHIQVWRQCGVNRVSVGVQSLKTEALLSLNRMHTSDDVTQAIRLLANQFRSLSVDLMVGLPLVCFADWKAMLRTVVTWPIQHISLYMLERHAHVPLSFSPLKRKIPGHALVLGMYRWAVDFFEDHGFVQYEISNFAQSGHQSQHNRVYWERKSYIGFGVGACSFDGCLRVQNTSNLMAYLEALEAGLLPPARREVITPRQLVLEKLMLSLRLREGLDLDEFNKHLDSAHQASFARMARELVASDLLSFLPDGRLSLSRRGVVLENEIILRLSSTV